MSTISVSWASSFEFMDEIHRHNHEFLNNLVLEQREDLKKRILNKNIPGLSLILEDILSYHEKLSKEFLQNHTIDKLRSENYTVWVEKELNKINQEVLRIKNVIEELSIMLKSANASEDYDEIINFLEKHFPNAHNFLQAIYSKRDILKYGESVKKQQREQYGEFIKAKFQEIVESRADKANKRDEEEGKDKKEELIKKVKSLYNKLVAISEAKAKEYENMLKDLDKESEFRLNLIKDALASEYLKMKKLIVEDNVYRHEVKVILEESIKNNYESIIEKANRILSSKYVSKRDYESLYSEYSEYVKKTLEQRHKPVEKAALEDKIQKFLHSRGYQFLYTTEHGVVYARTPFGDDYLIQLKVNEDGSFSVKFLKVVEDKNAISKYERQKDVEVAKRWCGNLDALIDMLNQSGIIVDTKTRIEPEEKMNYYTPDELPEFVRSYYYERRHKNEGNILHKQRKSER